jgi:uracil-DNA glycosylase
VDRESLSESWQAQVGDQFDQPYMRALQDFLSEEKTAEKVIYPPSEQVFAAFNQTPFNKVKVVILGQDPYHGPSQAHGLCFSVAQGVKAPPSLVNIYKELVSDVSIEMPDHGQLSRWAEQGVLLLNSVLTVEQAQANAHQGKGWEAFTDRVISVINAQREHIVFMLWGSYAQKKGAMIDRSRHCVLSAPHPSPLSAYRGFFGCKHFSQANDYLELKGLKPINWQP